MTSDVDDVVPDLNVITDEASTKSSAVHTFHLVTGAVVALSSFYLAWLVRNGTFGIGYQGDEGLRVFDAYQSALQHPNSVHGGVVDSTLETFFGVHPPGDNLIRSLTASALDTVGVSTGPVSTMFVLSIGAVAIAHVLAAEFARRSGGVAAGYLTLFFLLGSYVFNDIKVSSMGEALSAPLLVAALVLLQRALAADSAPLSLYVTSGVVFGLATFVRPEVPFLLPGLCIALWILVGFSRAAIFGLFAGSFEFAKLVNSAFFADDDELTLLNVGASFFNGRKDLGELWRSDFIQQLVREPGLLIFLGGCAASVVYVFSTRERATNGWRTHAVLVSGIVSYLLINIASQFLGSSPHASYRIVTAIAPLLAITFALAIVHAANRARPYLQARYGEVLGSSIVFSVLVLLCAWGAYVFVTDRIDELAGRVPEGVRSSADEVLARSEPSDAIFVDHLRYWNNAMLGYFADRDAPVCNYARCAIADHGAEELWAEVRSVEAVPGTRSWGEFTAVHMHHFISTYQPSHIVIASEDLHREWTRVASGIWGADAPLWSSHIFPYLDGEVDFDRPGEQYLRLGTIDEVEYFDEYVFLIPRSRNDVGIVYEAFYGRTPPTAE